MPLLFSSEDITQIEIDAIVNAANSELRGGGGVCGAIFRAAGYSKMQAACRALGQCEVGQAVITEGFDLPAKYVIHTVGPRYQPGNLFQADLLRQCYINSINLAYERGLKSIAFPLISSGIYGYPRYEALHIAVSSIFSMLQLYGNHTLEITLCLRDPELHKAAYELREALECHPSDASKTKR